MCFFGLNPLLYLGLDTGFCIGEIIFGLIWFLLKKIIKSKKEIKKTKLVQTGLTWYFYFGLVSLVWLVFFCLAWFLFWFFSVCIRFGFFNFRIIKLQPNQTSQVFQNFNLFNQFFSRFDFFSYFFFRFSRLNRFFSFFIHL
jgi:uncharacterized membrane protein YciS (DUF1049 family)